MHYRLNYLIAGCFVALIFLTIIFVTAILPATTFQPDASPVAINYDLPQYAAAKRGRNIYRREGCFYCHTQFTRYQDRETGEMVAAGDYVYETPHLLGTERTGPDLSNEGGKFPDAWHVAHHKQPRSVKPGSIMPAYDYLTDAEMSDLVTYIQALGIKRSQIRRAGLLKGEETAHAAAPSMANPELTWLEAPQEIQDEWVRIAKNVDTNNSAIANSGRGIFMQNCAVCHGVSGRGNGPASNSMLKKPANLTRSFYAAYSDPMFYWRIKEGVQGTRMPKWGRSLSEQQMAYLVAFVKTLPVESNTPSAQVETTSLKDLDMPQKMRMSENFDEINRLDEIKHEHTYVYGGGRH